VLRNFNILANITATQDVHRLYGGVVPEMASREHQKHIVPVVHAALHKAGITAADLDAIAYTQGPGLLGSLLVGASFAKSMALALGIPSLPVHHMKAHVLAHFIAHEGMSAPPFPFMCLTVSGGHTQLLLVHSAQHFELLGQTSDDAAGEAFDKAARVLGLPYPGGPEIDKLSRNGDPHKFTFTKPKVPGLDFSFSGLKTGFRLLVEKGQQADPAFAEKNMADLCASIQHTIVSMLLTNLEKAMQQTGITHVALAGGVSANAYLRASLSSLAAKKGWTTYTTPLEYCTDNGAMIAIAGYFDLAANRTGVLSDAAKARMGMG
jgi:N6-L-threonylcarbamoyladenine synthase